MESTVGEFYRLTLPEEIPLQELALDTDLADIFNISPKRRKGVRPAQEMLREHRKPIIDKVAYWSGVQRPIVKRLVEAICSVLRTWVYAWTFNASPSTSRSSLCTQPHSSMNYLTRGKFIHP